MNIKDNNNFFLKNGYSILEDVFDKKYSNKIVESAKEIKGKSDDQATKSKQYLEGLLKIPFGNYRKEPILNKLDELNETFETVKHIINVTEKEKYTLFEISTYNNEAKEYVENKFKIKGYKYKGKDKLMTIFKKNFFK